MVTVIAHCARACLRRIFAAMPTASEFGLSGRCIAWDLLQDNKSA